MMAKQNQKSVLLLYKILEMAKLLANLNQQMLLFLTTQKNALYSAFFVWMNVIAVIIVLLKMNAQCQYCLLKNKLISLKKVLESTLWSYQTPTNFLNVQIIFLNPIIFNILRKWFRIIVETVKIDYNPLKKMKLKMDLSDIAMIIPTKDLINLKINLNFKIRKIDC